MSALLRLQPGEDNPAQLGFVASLALHDAASGLVSADLLQLKWPNDVLLDGGKLSGILLEMEDSFLILGIGVNLAAAPHLPDRKTTALVDYGAELDAAAFAARLADAFATRRAQWRNHGFAAIRQSWLAHAHPPGTALRVTRSNEIIDGYFAGLAEDGALQLKLESGKLLHVHAGDVWQLPPASDRAPDPAVQMRG